MTAISLQVNGVKITDDVEPRQSLADFLRDRCGLTATHLGCEIGACGACTVTVDGVLTRSCLKLAVMSDGREVMTLEGLRNDAADGAAAALLPRKPRAAMRLLHAGHADRGARHPAAARAAQTPQPSATN